MRIDINDQFYFSEFQPSDKEACLEHFKFRGIYENTLRLPFPYTEADFHTWMGIVEKTKKEQGQPVYWAIRNAEGLLIGGLGFDDFIIGKSHRAEIGYWLAKPFWGTGDHDRRRPEGVPIRLQPMGLGEDHGTGLCSELRICPRP